MTQRLMSDDDTEFRDWVAITEADRYQSSFTPDHGEAELRKLCYRFKLPFTEVKDAFREFKDSTGSMTFPLLNLPDLMVILSSEFRMLDLTEDDFVHPNGSRWHEVFTLLLARLTGNSLIDIKSRMTKEVSRCELSEFHRSGLETALLARALHRVLIPAGIDNFSTKDINGPTKKRLLRIMSAIVNYARYRTERQDDYDECCQNLQKRRSDYDALLAQRDSIIQKINDKKKAKAEQDEKVAVIKEQKDRLLKSMAEKQNYVASMTNEVKELTTKAQSVLADQVQYDESVKSLMRESECLESKIMQSPERAVREKALMEAKLEQIQVAYDEKLMKLDAVSSAAQLQRSDECRQACKLLESISEPAARMRQITIEMKRANDEQQQLNSQVVDLSAKTQSARCTVAARQEKFDKQQLQQRLKEDSLKKQLEELQMAHSRISGDGETLRRLDKEHKLIVGCIADQREASKSRMEQLEKSKESLLCDVENYNRTFFYPFVGEADE